MHASLIPHYVTTGSRISGIGYSTEILTDIREGLARPSFAVRLTYQGISRIMPILPDPNDLTSERTRAHELMERFCNVCHAWNRVQSIHAWLSASPNHAIIGRF